MYPHEYPGALWYDQEEVDAVSKVISNKSPFRYYGVKCDKEVFNFEKELRSKPIPEKNIKSLKLKDLFNKYKVEILPKLKSYTIVCFKLNVLSRSWLGEIKVINLTKRHLEQFCADRKLIVKDGTIKSELRLIKRVFKIAIDKWNYGIPFNAFNGLGSGSLDSLSINKII